MTKRKTILTRLPQPIDEREARRIQRKSNSMDVRKLIEKGFAKKISIVEHNKPAMVTALEAILRQLTDRAAKGDKRAPRVINLYQDYVSRNSADRNQTFTVRAASASDPEDKA